MAFLLPFSHKVADFHAAAQLAGPVLADGSFPAMCGRKASSPAPHYPADEKSCPKFCDSCRHAAGHGQQWLLGVAPDAGPIASVQLAYLPHVEQGNGHHFPYDGQSRAPPRV